MHAYKDGEEIPVDWQMPLQNELKYFVKCIKEDLRPSPSIHDGLRALEIIDTAEKHI